MIKERQMKPQRLKFRRLYRNLDKIVLLFFIVFLLMELVWIPFNSFVAENLLKQTGYLFLSYTNVGKVLSSNYLVTIGFILIFIANLFVSYFQIGMIFMGIHNLLDKEERSVFQFFNKTLRDSLSMVKRTRIGSMLFISCYMGILFPFLRKILKIYYLNKILIPDFIVTYFQSSLLSAVLVLFLVCLMLLLAVRLMFALPKILFEGKSVREAVQFSLQKTKKHLIFYSWHLFWIVAKSFLIFLLLTSPLLLLQQYVDSQFNQMAFSIAVANFVLIKIAYYFMLAYFLLKFLAFLTDSELKDYRLKKGFPFMRWFILSLTAIAFSFEAVYYLKFPLETVPITISHRGVSAENGVQNTVESLKKTALLKPDYIEVDIQETKDGKFVMMHDANLENLAGVNAKPQDLTLEELEALKISENGYTTNISSFEEYFKTANQLGQRLLIEIKTSDQDSSNMVEKFLKQYGATIKLYAHQIQSLDYRVIDKVIQYDKDIPTFFILPYNTIFPQTKAFGYTMEYSTLDQNFVDKLWKTDKQLYDWTINDENSISKSFSLGVDGMITDDLELVQNSIKELKNSPQYTTILVNQTANLFYFI